MTLEAKIELSKGVLEKLNPQNYSLIIQDVVKSLTLEAERQCKKECPVQTGALRDSHSTEIKEDSGKVTNRQKYVLRVIYGGKHPVSPHLYFNRARNKKVMSYGTPNNFPQRALNTMSSQKMGSRAVEEAMKRYGVKQ